MSPPGELDRYPGHWGVKGVGVQVMDVSAGIGGSKRTVRGLGREMGVVERGLEQTSRDIER